MVPAWFVGRGRLYALVATSILTLGLAPAQVPVPESADLDPRRLEVVENLSESLANDLLGLSVATRNRDLTEIAAFFPERLTTAPLPTEPGPVEAELKWPNDALVRGRKLAGVLTESSSSSRGVDWVVVGIGLNVAVEPASLGPVERSATSLHFETEQTPAVRNLAVAETE